MVECHNFSLLFFFMLWIYCILCHQMYSTDIRFIYFLAIGQAVQETSK